MDANFILSDEQDIGVAAGDVISTNVIDLGDGGYAGDGQNLALVVDIPEALASAGAATLVIALQDCATEGGTYRDVIVSRAFALADVAKSNDKHFLVWGIPGGVQGVRQFVRCRYTIAVATTTAGTVTARLEARAA
jgi:hypothetical protein